MIGRTAGEDYAWDTGPVELRHQDHTRERLLRRARAVVARRRRDPGDRARLAVRSPPAAVVGPVRGHLRGLDAAGRARGADRPVATRTDRHEQPPSTAVDAGQ